MLTYLKNINTNCIKYKLNKRELHHMVRVGELSLQLAEKLKLKKIELIHTSGRLHDIGKAYIHPFTLNKPGKLTDNEFEHIKEHVTYSAIEALDKGYSVDVVNNILFHHENYNGTGYPFGLKGDDIPLGARIIRICDTYDALTMDRPYRNKLTINEAIAIMDKEINNYDPEIYKLFKKLIKKGEIL